MYLCGMMKWLSLSFLLVNFWFSNAQVFHFNENEYTFNKTTDNSPVHWYFEIFNDVGVDTLLRWKTHFNSIPSQWYVNFDAQTSSWSLIQDGDSADFVLQTGLSFPQKLIIGVNTANTIGNGSISFEIYDPNEPVYRDTIIFYFNISYGTSGLAEVGVENEYLLMNQQITLLNGEKADFYAYNSAGQLIGYEKKSAAFDCSSLAKSDLQYIRISAGKKQFCIKMMPTAF